MKTEDSPPLWADILLSLWTAVIALIYFGGYFVPVIGVWTSKAALVYAVMLLVSITAVYIKSRPSVLAAKSAKTQK